MRQVDYESAEILQKNKTGFLLSYITSGPMDQKLLSILFIKKSFYVFIVFFSP